MKNNYFFALRQIRTITVAMKQRCKKKGLWGDNLFHFLIKATKCVYEICFS